MIHFDNQDINAEGTAAFAGPISCLDCFHWLQEQAIAVAGTAVGMESDPDSLNIRISGEWNGDTVLECENCFDEFARGVAA